MVSNDSGPNADADGDDDDDDDDDDGQDEDLPDVLDLWDPLHPMPVPTSHDATADSKPPAGKWEEQGKQEQQQEEGPSQLRQIMQACRRQRPVGSITHCPLCQGLIEDPVITRKCRHVFCRVCLTSAITARSRGCPYKDGACGQQLNPGLDFEPLNPSSRAAGDGLGGEGGAWQDEDDGDGGNDDGDAAWKLDHENLMLQFVHSTKTLALRDQLREWQVNHPDDKIVIFSQFTRMLDIAEHVIDQEGWICTRYQGGMSLNARQEALDNFRCEPECHIMLTSIKAGGVGLNLAHANLVVSLDLWWNVAVELQAFDRVHRLGQKKEVFITRFLVRNTVEERLLDLQQQKLQLAKAALGEGDLALGKLTREELLSLFVSLNPSVVVCTRTNRSV